MTAADDLAGLVAAGVDRTLELAATWLRWDGLPRVGEDPGRIYAPHKALRRYTDHLLDHLAHMECLVADVETIPDGWWAGDVTLETDWAHFTEADLAEAGQRLRRLALLYRLRLSAWGHPNGRDRVARTGLSARSSSMSPTLGIPNRLAISSA